MLAAAMPRAGGQYLTEPYGPLWGFLYGWTLVLVIQTGTIAAVGRRVRDVLTAVEVLTLGAVVVSGLTLGDAGARAANLACSGVYLLTVGGLLVLARRTGQRPHGAGYPWLQVAYLAAVSVLVLDLLVTKPAYTWGSCAVVLSGLPCYAVLRRWPVSE